MRVSQVRLSRFTSKLFTPDDSISTFRHKSFVKLVFEAGLFKLCSFELATKLASTLLKSKSMGGPFRFAFRHSVFTHFCAGEEFKHCNNEINDMYKQYNVTTILDHSTEELTCADSLEINKRNKIELIQKSASQIGKDKVQFIPIKCTSLIEPVVLESITTLLMNVSNQTNNTEATDGQVLSQLSTLEKALFDKGLQRFHEICIAAQTAQISILLDAEQMHRQPAIELIYRQLAPTYNRLNTDSNNNHSKPVVYNTYQCYLSRTEYVIEKDLEHALNHQYMFAVKLVRGAYWNVEMQKARDSNCTPPVLQTKEQTDKVYNKMITKLLGAMVPMQNSRSDLFNSTDIVRTNNIHTSYDDNTDSKTNESNSAADNAHISQPQVHLLLATHNNKSITHAVYLMNQYCLPNNNKNIHFAQIKGMCDNITNALGLAGYNVSKLVIYGQFEEVLPWLLRRLEENQVRCVCKVAFCV